MSLGEQIRNITAKEKKVEMVEAWNDWGIAYTHVWH